MRIAIAWALLLLTPTSSVAQSQKKSRRAPDSDLLGMTCSQVLAMTSSEWIAKVAGAGDSSEDPRLRGIKGYGKCYDERTDRLAASLARSRKGPSLRARTSFRGFVVALDDFTSKALADSQPPGDDSKKAYAALYEKEFRYQFYQSYERKPAPASGGPAVTPPSRPAAKPAPPVAGAPVAGEKPSNAPVSEMTRAKNRFGELLDNMPADKLHEIHAAFGKVVEFQPIASDQELTLYCYAIFVLEPSASQAGPAGHPPAAKPFAPPPF
jgi:hypothetical protein